MLKLKPLELLPSKPEDTLFINLFGGPGSGKSTMAAMIFSELKLLGVNCEYVSEYAKDKVWQEDFKALECQPYITAKQMFRQFRLLGKVRVVITDSPLLLGNFYGGFGNTQSFNTVLREWYELFNNLNIFVVRSKEYNPHGRYQDEDQAKAKDFQILEYLEYYYPIQYLHKNDPTEIINIILEKLYEQDQQCQK